MYITSMKASHSSHLDDGVIYSLENNQVAIENGGFL